MSRSRRTHTWQAIEYQIEASAGELISAGPLTRPPQVRIPLGVAGWHKIYLGLWVCGRSDTGWGRSTMGDERVGGLRVRLSGDSTFVTVRREEPSRESIEETYLKAADLTHQQLVVEPPSRGFAGQTSLAFVRLEPMTEPEVRTLAEDLHKHEHKRLCATNDSFGMYFRDLAATESEIRSYVEPYRDTDFSMLLWEVVSGMVGGWTPSLPLYADGVEDYPRVGDRNMWQALRKLSANGVNPTQVAIDHAHSFGLELHISIRAEMFQAAPPFEEVFSTPFYRAHPELQLVDRDGAKVTGLSYAYPEVRAHQIRMLCDAASLGADGVAVIFPRSGPYVLYEEPFLQDFIQRHGVDPREFPETDPRIHAEWAETMTQFMRELRTTVRGDRIERHAGAPTVSAIIFATPTENTRFGLDPAAWIAEDLVDRLMLYPCLADHSHHEIDVEYYHDLTRGKSCSLYYNVMPRHMCAHRYRALAKHYYHHGADGLLLWDTYQRHDFTSQWNVIRTLGHRGSLLEDDRLQPDGPRLHKLLRIGTHNLGRFSPYRGA